MKKMLTNIHHDKYLTSEYKFSTHSLKRCQQRAVSSWAIEQALLRGDKIHKQGYTFHFLRRKCVVNNYLPQHHKQLFDLVVLLGEDRTVITAYKNSKAIGEIKRKSKRLVKWKSCLVNINHANPKNISSNADNRIAA